MIETLTNFFGKTPAETEGSTPEGLCANCWGHYEYDGKIRSVARDRQIDVNHHLERRAFIEDFVVTHVDGIRLKNDGLSRQLCPQCGRSPH
ncbi:MAG: hypothetical protein KC912_10415 [Proteobacteria bacterium]|nr:hypothetical protein [Pseudomonadota bacterium]